MNENIKEVSWEEFNSLVYKIYEQVKNKNIKAIVGIPRGGLIPAVMLSHLLDVPMFQLIQHVFSYPHENILVMDDILDVGRTLIPYIHENYSTATIFVNKKRCKCYPAFFAEETTDWIKFPYEINITDKVSKINYENNNSIT